MAAGNATNLDRLTFTYNGLVLNETSAIVPNANNWYKVDSINLDVVAARNFEGPRALEDGIEDYDTYLGQREILIKGAIICEDISTLNSYTQNLRKTFNPRLTQTISSSQDGYLPFTWAETIAATTYNMQIDAKPSKPPEIVTYLQEFGGLVAAYTLFLKAKDPRKYNQTPTTGNLTSGTPSVSVVNNGDYYSFATFTITGPVSTPTITNFTTGEYLTINTTLSSGQEVSVSMFDRKISGSVNYYQYKSSGSNFPFYISAGTVALNYSAGTVSSSNCAYSFRDAWI